MAVQFQPGNNIAIKVPSHQYEEVVKFYQDTLGLPIACVDNIDPFESTAFEFGSMHLWVDKKPGISQAEIWLEMRTDDAEKAAQYLTRPKCVRCDEIEPLPETLKAFWVANTAGIVHLISE